MLHSSTNTDKDLNKGFERHGDNTVRAQGVSYNPAGSNTSTANANSTYNTTNNSTTNSNTKANAETIGGGIIGTDAHKNSKISSNLTMGDVQPPSINDLPGSYPSHSSNAPLDSKASGQAGHGSSVNNQSVGFSTNHNNPQTGAHSSQYGNATHDKLSHNTTDVHNSTNTNSSKVAPVATLSSLTNEYPRVLPNRSSNITLDTTSSGQAINGKYTHDPKLQNNTHGHTNSTVLTGNNISSVNDEVYGTEFGKAPVHEQTIAGDNKYKSTHPHQTGEPERVGETHLHDQVISKDIKNASPKSGTHSRSLSNNNSERIGENRQDDKEVAEGLISEKTHAHLDHTPEKVKENHKLDLAEPLDDKNIIADPNSTSLYNEHTAATLGEGVKPSNPGVTTLESGNHHDRTGEANLRAPENNHHGSTTHNSSSKIVAGATVAALGAIGLANALHGKQKSSLHNSGLKNNSSDVASGDVGSANLYESQHGSSSLRSGSNNNTLGTVLGDVGSANIYESQHGSSTHNSGFNNAAGTAGLVSSHHNKQEPSIHSTGLNNNASGISSGDVGSANLYESQHGSSSLRSGSNNNTLGTVLGDVGSANIYESQHGSSTHNSGPNTSTGAILGSAGLANVYDDRNLGAAPKSTDFKQSSLTSNTLNNSKFSGTTDTPAPNVQNNNDYPGSTTSNHSSNNRSHGIRNAATGAAVGAGATDIASSLSSHNNKPPHDISLDVNGSSLSGATTGNHSSTNPAHGSNTITGTGSSLDNHHHNSATTTTLGSYDDKISGSTTSNHTSSNHSHGITNTATGAAVGVGATDIASSLSSHNNKSPRDTSLNTNNNNLSGATTNNHSSTNPTHGSGTTTGAGSGLDSHHHKPITTTSAGVGTHGNAPIESTTRNHSSHKSIHGSNQVGFATQPELYANQDLDAVDTKPSKVGGYMDKMMGAFHESIGKAFNNEEMIEKGTLEKAKGEQKILLAQEESQSKHQ